MSQNGKDSSSKQHHHHHSNHFHDSVDDITTLPTESSDAEKEARNSADNNETEFTSDSDKFSDAEEMSKGQKKEVDAEVRDSNAKKQKHSPARGDEAKKTKIEKEKNKKEKNTKKEETKEVKNAKKEETKEEKNTKKDDTKKVKTTKKEETKKKTRVVEEQDPTADDSDPYRLMLFHRLTEFPAIMCILNQYQQARVGGLLSMPIAVMEFCLAMATLPATAVVVPVSHICSTPIFVVDWCLCKGLDVVQAVCPCLAVPPERKLKKRKTPKNSKKGE